MSAFETIRVRTSSGRGAKDSLIWLAGLKLCLLDFVIALGRKVGGFCALLSLGWLYFRLLALGQPVSEVYPGAVDPDLRHTLWVGLLLIMAQGWDIPTDRLVELWDRLACHVRPIETREASVRSLPQPLQGAWGGIEPVVAALGRFMDLCVAIANKVGAFGVVCYLLFLAERLLWARVGVGDMYPEAVDPQVSFLADLCVYVVVLGWWAMPFEEIATFWRRLRRPACPPGR